jgi:hypothetical protein
VSRISSLCSKYVREKNYPLNFKQLASPGNGLSEGTGVLQKAEAGREAEIG